MGAALRHPFTFSVPKVVGNDVRIYIYSLDETANNRIKLNKMTANYGIHSNLTSAVTKAQLATVLIGVGGTGVMIDSTHMITSVKNVVAMYGAGELSNIGVFNVYNEVNTINKIVVSNQFLAVVELNRPFAITNSVKLSSTPVIDNEEVFLVGFSSELRRANVGWEVTFGTKKAAESPYQIFDRFDLHNFESQGSGIFNSKGELVSIYSHDYKTTNSVSFINSPIHNNSFAAVDSDLTEGMILPDLNSILNLSKIQSQNITSPVLPPVNNPDPVNADIAPSNIVNSIKNIYNNSIISTVAVTYDGSISAQEMPAGAGVIISNSYVLTAAHVVGYANTVTIFTSSGERLHGTEVSRDTDKDLSLIKLDTDIKYPVAILANSAPSINDYGYLIGNPQTQWSDNGGWQTSTLKTISTEGYKYQTHSSNITFGNSGGPVFNMNGNLTGIVSGMTAQTTNSVDIADPYSATDPPSVGMNTTAYSISKTNISNFIKPFVTTQVQTNNCAIKGSTQDNLILDVENDNTIIDGLSGVDTAVYNTISSDVLFTRIDNSTIEVKFNGFTDKLINIEKIQFADNIIDASSISTYVPVIDTSLPCSVPGTMGNDYFIPSGNNSYFGGAGNDTYIVSAKILNIASTVKIIDIEGTNVVQIVDGTIISSSTFFNNAVMLNLNTGASIQVLNASYMNFQIGANAVIGDVAVSKTYQQFASEFGVVVPSGTNSVNGFGNYVVPYTPSSGQLPNEIPSIEVIGYGKVLELLS